MGGSSFRRKGSGSSWAAQQRRKDSSASGVASYNKPPDDDSPMLHRERLIKEGWRLAQDPFKVAVSESDATFNFARIYVDPPLEAGEPNEDHAQLRDRLKAACHSFIFANYGMGKTATSLALAFELREAYGHDAVPILHVTYQPGFHGEAPDDHDVLRRQHLAQIARHMTTDLVIQTLERLNERLGGAAALTATEHAALERQLGAAPQSLRLALGHLITRRIPPDRLWGVLRPTVRPELATAGWYADVQALIEPFLHNKPTSFPLDTILADARALGFGPIFISLDALDNATIAFEEVRRRIEPLLPLLDRWQAQQVYFKCFLPVELRAAFDHDFIAKYTSLTPSPDLATIAASTPNHLMEILDRRLQAVTTPASFLGSLEDMRGPGIKDSITETLVEHAHGSPRRVLELAARLFEFHSSHGYAEAERLWMTVEEWATFLKEISSPEAAPPT